jgi:hypothetical protein
VFKAKAFNKNPHFGGEKAFNKKKRSIKIGRKIGQNGNSTWLDICSTWPTLPVFSFCSSAASAQKKHYTLGIGKKAFNN